MREVEGSSQSVEVRARRDDNEYVEDLMAGSPDVEAAWRPFLWHLNRLALILRSGTLEGEVYPRSVHPSSDQIGYGHPHNTVQRHARTGHIPAVECEAVGQETC